ncbi:hypothetical protein EF888_07120 [Silicimonas algicola]|uniref:Uncharacterized protein n=1 Tax=Silicimonas algicola TaxID=1826607 RepID=A0A316G2I3_9RHOB|nr:hypothetical protein [Silicimonas algicola]AZQ66930.1 hypothetical protein EF888_07120 [Silicimonas algicola]PWK55154.1 hypothetical protein C8D95_10829 [Silicimonas algicola]
MSLLDAQDETAALIDIVGAVDQLIDSPGHGFAVRALLAEARDRLAGLKQALDVTGGRLEGAKTPEQKVLE